MLILGINDDKKIICAKLNENILVLVKSSPSCGLVWKFKTSDNIQFLKCVSKPESCAPMMGNGFISCYIFRPTCIGKGGIKFKEEKASCKGNKLKCVNSFSIGIKVD